MAGRLRAALVLAALPLSVSGSWEKTEKFTDSNCTVAKPKSVDYVKLGFCMPYGSTGSAKQECVGGKIKTTTYNDTACTTVQFAGTPKDATCDARGGGEYEKEICVTSLPSTHHAVEVEYYIAAANCTGAKIMYTSGAATAEIGSCEKNDDDTSEIVTISSTSQTVKRYTTADCSGTPVTNTTACGACVPQGSTSSMIIPCSSMAGLAIATGAIASQATALAVSKVAVVALAGMVARILA